MLQRMVRCFRARQAKALRQRQYEAARRIQFNWRKIYFKWKALGLFRKSKAGVVCLRPPWPYSAKGWAAVAQKPEVSKQLCVLPSRK